MAEKFVAEVADKFSNGQGVIYNYEGKQGSRHVFTSGRSTLSLFDDQVREYLDLSIVLREYKVLVPELHYATYVADAASPEEAMQMIEHGHGRYSYGTEFSNVISPDQVDWCLYKEGGEDVAYEKVYSNKTRRDEWGVKGTLRRGYGY